LITWVIYFVTICYSTREALLKSLNLNHTKRKTSKTVSNTIKTNEQIHIQHIQEGPYDFRAEENTDGIQSKKLNSLYNAELNGI